MAAAAATIGKYVAHAAVSATSFILGYFAGKPSESENSNDKNNGLVNNEIKIIERESPKFHVEVMVYVIVAIIIIIFLIKLCKCVKSKKVKSSDSEENEMISIVA